jgi:hypothetical protein
MNYLCSLSQNLEADKKTQKKWTSPLHHWNLIIQQLYIKFGEQLPLDISIPKSS